MSSEQPSTRTRPDKFQTRNRKREAPAHRGATDAGAAPKSAARLAAEAAFAAPEDQLSHRLQTQLLQAQITVRRPRVASARSLESESGEPFAPALTQTVMQTVSKGPRVFRMPVVQTNTMAPEAARYTQWHEGTQPEQPRPLTRARRLAADKRPGPVLHVVHELPQRPSPASLQPNLGGLAAEVNQVGLVLEDIRRARAFRFGDASMALEWQALGQLAENIRQQIRAGLALPSFKSAVSRRSRGG